ncbi:hypothetical protein AUJ10_02070 [Candidatus Pacearchaeota archaeon CG1_02_31_27]|nr:MAG: hypothetical protein AUJ10_02070 [Candidatus Pacearchaeota archaeon CG1_02_31_27]
MENEKLEKKKARWFIAWIIFLIVFLIFAFINIPLKEKIISEDGKVVQLSWIGTSKDVVIDENREFSSPRLFTAGFGKFGINKVLVDLKPGIYYWKASGGITFVRKIEIQSLVGINVERNESHYEIQNTGNVGLSVNIKQKSGITGGVILDYNEKENVQAEENSEIIAYQNEK